MKRFLRQHHIAVYYLKCLVIGAAIIATAVYAPDRWLDLLSAPDRADYTSLRVILGLFGASVILLDPVVGAGAAVWDHIRRRREIGASR